MSARFGFHIGPFYFSQRLGRTQAQKRAAAKARQSRAWEREKARRTITMSYTVTGIEPDGTLVLCGGKGRLAYTVRVKPPRKLPGLAAGQVVEVVKAWSGDRVLDVRPGSAEAVAERQAADTYEERTHRYVVSECHLDPLKGGGFTLEAEDAGQVHIKLDAETVTHFLSLRKGDIVEVTLAPEQAGLEEFWHICRANGAKPRSPVELSADNMRWLGLTGTRSTEPPDQSG